MSAEREAIVGELFARMSAGGIDAALELLTPDVVIVVPPELSAEPDVYEGHEGALRYMRGFEGLMEDVRFRALWINEEDGQMVVGMELSGRGTQSGLEVTQSSAVLVSFANGLVSRMEPYPDRESARAEARGR